MTSMKRTAILGLGLAGLMGACGAPSPPPAAPVPDAPAAPPAPPARQPPPPPLPARPIEFPPFRETVLPNGLRLIVVEKHDQPVANVNLYVATGTAADPMAKLGLAGMASEVLTKGTARRSAQQIAALIEGVGGNLGSSATADYTAVSADVLADQLPLALDLVSDVTLRPTFPRAEVDLARTRTLSSLQLAMSQPGEVAQRRFARAIYGERHPYGSAPLAATVRAITRGDLVGFHNRYFRADNALLVVSGDVDAARVEELVRQRFGGWKGGGAPQVTFVEPPARQGPALYLVNRPGSVQSNILVGGVAVKPDNPDYYPLQVMNQIVGGGTDSRLFTILREQKGWTYGSYSRLSRPKDVGVLAASAEVRTAVTDSALTEMMSQLRRIREETVSQAELDAAKSYLTGSFPLRIETAGQIASQIARNRLLGLPAAELTAYRDRIQAVTAVDVQRVARQYVRPDQAVIVVVGEASQLYDRLKDIAPVTLTDLEGRPMQLADIQVRASGERFDASRLKPMTLEYQIQFQGNTVGTATLTLAREGNAWHATQVIRAGPASQEQQARFTNDFTPISARQSASGGPMQMQVDMKFADGKVTGSAKLPAQMGGDKTLDAQVPAGTVFSGMDQWVIAAADLQPGRTVTLPVFSPQTGGAINATFKVVGTEQVTVPAGTFQAYKVESTVGPQSMTLYLRRDAPHIGLKQEPAGQPVSIVLQAIK